MGECDGGFTYTVAVCAVIRRTTLVLAVLGWIHSWLMIVSVCFGLTVGISLH